MKKRTLLFRIGAIVILLAIAAVMMVIGRGHTVYLDNKKLEYNGKTYDTPYKVVVLVDGEQVAKLYDRERGSATCIGQKFTVTLESTEKKGGSAVMMGPPHRMGSSKTVRDEVQHGERERTLYVLRDGKPVEAKVVTGLTDGTRTEIVSGEIREGDKIIVDQRRSERGRIRGNHGAFGFREIHDDEHYRRTRPPDGRGVPF